jgi:hypothetical protein
MYTPTRAPPSPKAHRDSTGIHLAHNRSRNAEEEKIPGTTRLLLETAREVGMVRTSKIANAAQQEIAERDAQIRLAEVEQTQVAGRLVERGAILTRVPTTADTRKLSPPRKQPMLTRSAAYIEYREATSQSGARDGGVPAYLRAEAEPRGEKAIGREEHDRPPTAAEIHVAVHARTKLLIAEAQQAALKRAQKLARRLDSFGVLDPQANQTRVASLARLELRRHVSVAELQQRAEDQVRSGVPARSEVPAAVAAVKSGGGLQKRAAGVSMPQLLSGKLELLDEEMSSALKPRKVELANVSSGYTRHGSNSRQSRSRGSSGLTPVPAPPSRGFTTPSSIGRGSTPLSAAGGPRRHRQQLVNLDTRLNAQSKSMPNLVY